MCVGGGGRRKRWKEGGGGTMVRFRRGRGLWGREEGLGGLIGMGGREGGRWFGSCIDRDTSFHHIVTISF